MSASKYSYEIWNAANDTRQYVFKDETVFSANVTDELNGEHSIELTIDRRDNAWAQLTHGKIIRLFDGSLTNTYTSFRIVSLQDGRSQDNQITGVIKGEHIKYDLSEQIHNAAEEIIEQTPTTHLTKILTGSGFTVGTVTPTDRVTIPYAYNTRLFDLEQVRALTSYDLVINEDKSVDLETRGSATKASIRYRKNMMSIRRTLDRITGNIMYGVGGEGNIKQVMTISEATHRITVIAGTTLTLDSRKIVSSNDSLNNLYVEKPNGTFTQITDSIKQGSGNDQLVVASAADLSVGNAIKIRTSNVATARLEYIPDATSRAAYGDVQSVFKDESIQEIQNLVGPHASSALSGTYTAGLCEGWSEVGNPTTTENTTASFIKYGTKSQKVVVATIAAPSNAPTATLGGGGVLSGDYQYKKTWRSVDGETTASSATSTISPSSQTVVVGRNESAPTHIDSWRIYRTKAGGATFYFIADVPAATTNYDDNKPDAQLTITEPVTNKAAGGQGVERTFTSVTDQEYAAVVWVYVETGNVRIELHTGTSFFPDLNIASLKRATPTRATTTLWIVTIQGLIATGTSGRIRVVAHEAAATFYVDAAMVVKNAYAPAEGVFISDNSATDLWYETYDALQASKDPKTTYDIAGIDFFEYDKGGYPDDQIRTGDTIVVADEELNLESSLRVVKKSFNALEPWSTARFEVSNEPNRFTGLVRRIIEREKDFNRAIVNRAVRLTQQVSQERATADRPIIEFSELT